MSQTPRVVACLPAWNASGFIQRTLEALAAQTYENLEVLVSVDQSPDDTATVCDNFARHDSRFRVVRQRQRLGWIGNVNAVLHLARGNYFFFAFHDDIVLPEYVASLVDALEGRPDAISAFTDLELRDLDGRRKTLEYTALEGVTDPVERAKRVLWMIGDWWVPHRGLFRAMAAAKIGGLKRNWAGEFSADWPWQVHMSLLGEIVRVPRVLCRKFNRVEGVSTSWNRNAWERLAVACSCAREIHQSRLTPAEKIRLQMTVASVSRALLAHSFVKQTQGG
jgi:glycosyltransferase involved in cell wall biosynthesis